MSSVRCTPWIYACDEAVECRMLTSLENARLDVDKVCKLHILMDCHMTSLDVSNDANGQ